MTVCKQMTYCTAHLRSKKKTKKNKKNRQQVSVISCIFHTFSLVITPWKNNHFYYFNNCNMSAVVDSWDIWHLNYQCYWLIFVENFFQSKDCCYSWSQMLKLFKKQNTPNICVRIHNHMYTHRCVTN